MRRKEGKEEIGEPRSAIGASHATCMRKDAALINGQMRIPVSSASRELPSAPQGRR
jgi:hypothetical protein